MGWWSRHRGIVPWRRLAAAAAAASLLLCLRLGLGAPMNDQGRVLLRFKEKVEFDPYGALSDWKQEAAAEACFWFGVQCVRGKVTSLDLKNLGLRGTLAPELGNLIHLKSLILHNNSFYGIIPREIASLQNLEVLDLGNNNFSSPLPSDIGSILPLKTLSLGGNRFMGSMLPQLHELSLLYVHKFSDDVLSSHKGSITRDVWDTTMRRLLQMASQHKGKKQISGTRIAKPFDSPAPAQPHTLKHPRIDKGSTMVLAPSSSVSPFLPPIGEPGVSPSPVSHFPASVPWPARVIESPSLAPGRKSDFVARPPSSSIEILSPTGSPPPIASPHTDAEHETSEIIYLVIGVGSIILVICSLYVICWRISNVVTINPWATGLSGQLQHAFVTGVPAVRRSELEAACEDFSNIIGSLSESVLYKGTLSSGVEIAVLSSVVKSAKEWSKQSESQFRRKVMMLSKVNHKNFVNLLGYCEEEEPFTRMMVFEYAPNGMLFEHLHVKEAEHLDWRTRLRIAMGIAYCLNYLNQLNPPVILKSLDSSTIYLTDDYAAKVSDLEFWSEPKETMSASEASGHLAEIGRESIVYKFGILMLEILSGKLPFTGEDCLLEHWASCYLNDERPLREMIDPTLSTFDEGSASVLCKVISSCINPEAKERPTIQEIVSRLRDITSMPPEGATPKVSPLWWAELEIISSEAN